MGNASTISINVEEEIDEDLKNTITYKSEMPVELLFSVHEVGLLGDQYVRLTYITEDGPIEFRSFIVALYTNESKKIF